MAVGLCPRGVQPVAPQGALEPQAWGLMIPQVGAAAWAVPRVHEPCLSLCLPAWGPGGWGHLGPPTPRSSHTSGRPLPCAPTVFPARPVLFPSTSTPLLTHSLIHHSFIHSPSGLGPHLRPAQWWGPRCPGAAPALWAQSPQRGPSTHVASFSLSDAHPSFPASLTCHFLQEAFQVSPDRNDSSCSYLKLSGYTSHPVSSSPHRLILTKCSPPTPRGCPLPALP